MWLYLAAPWWIVNIVKRKELRAQPLSPASSVSPRGRTGQERSPSPQIITRGDGPFNFIVAEGATPRFSTAKDQTPPLISATPSFVLMEIRPCLPATLSAEMQSWSAFPAGTTDDNDVLEELIVSFNPFFLLCVSFFRSCAPLSDRSLFFPTCWIWCSASCFARCSAPFTRRALRAASARRRLTPWNASPETCGVSRLGSPDTPGICS